MNIALMVAVTAVILAAVAVAVALATAARLREALQNGHVGGAVPQQPHVDDAVVPEFRTKTVNGRVLTNADLGADNRIIGFFSPDCTSCTEEAPRFAATGGQADAPPPVAVVVGGGGNAADLVLTLASTCTVVVEPDRGTEGLAAALGIRSFPTFLLVSRGRIVMGAGSVRALVGVQPVAV